MTRDNQSSYHGMTHQNEAASSPYDASELADHCRPEVDSKEEEGHVMSAPTMAASEQQNEAVMERQEDLTAVFNRYDRNKNGKIEIEELHEAMKDLGVLKGRSAAEASDCVVATFASLDADQDNSLTREEFFAYYKKASAPRLKDIIKKEHPELMKQLVEAYKKWSQFGGGRREASVAGGKKIGESMGSSHWMKLCRDTGLVSHSRSRGIPQSTADLIFTKVKEIGKKKITFSQFVDALGLVAKEMQSDIMSMIRQVVESDGPVANGTLVNAQRFSPAKMRRSSEMKSASDKYGGHSMARRSVDVQVSWQSQDTQDSVTPVQGRNSSGGVSTSSTIVSRRKSDIGTPASRLPGVSSTAARDDQRVLTPSADEYHIDSEALLHTFGEFAKFGRRQSLHEESVPPMQMQMDGKQFSKLCKDCGVARGSQDSVKVDLCFTKAKTKGRRLFFEDFLVALALLAGEKNMTEKQVYAMVAGCSGPRRNSTTPDAFVPWHDDKSKYTGVYARGGPKTVDGGQTDLAALLNRDIKRKMSL